MEIIIIIGLIILAFWVWRIQVKLETHDKLSQLAESIMWNTLLENDVISQETYEEALDRFKRNLQSALTSEKKKHAQIRALRALLEAESKKDAEDVAEKAEK